MGPGQNMPEMELQAEDIVRREDLDDAMEQDLAGERPAVALQVLKPCGALPECLQPSCCHGGTLCLTSTLQSLKATGSQGLQPLP